jgi:hypothetical protein
LGDAIRELAAEVGFEFDDDKTSVIDHSSYDANLVYFIKNIFCLIFILRMEAITQRLLYQKVN